MSFQALTDRLSATTQARFGEPVTFEPTDNSWQLLVPLTVQAVYTMQMEAVRPLDGLRQENLHTLECISAEVVGVDVTCLVYLRGQQHEILSINPDGLGTTIMLLGDPTEISW